jgi:hypothetical protein
MARVDDEIREIPYSGAEADQHGWLRAIRARRPYGFAASG